MAENPYNVGDVIQDANYFVGRSDIVKEIIENLPFHRATVIHGQRRIGKSSILARLEATLGEKNSNAIPVPIDLAGQLGKSVDQLAVQFSKMIRRKCKLTCPAIHPGEGAAEQFRATWLPEAINAVLDQKSNGIVLLLDEFDDVALNSTKTASDFYKYLGEILHGTAYGLRTIVVLGRDPAQLLETAQNMLMWAKSFHVSLLSRKELHSLMDLSKDSLSWSSDAKEELWDLTRGHPCISQMICSKIWYRKSTETVNGKKAAVEQRDVEEAFSYEEYGHVIDEAWGILLPEEQVIVCLIASKGSPQSEDDILSFIEEMELSDSYNETPLYNFLLKLTNSDWLDRDRNSYEIKVPAYQKWVKEHYELHNLANKLFNNNERAVSLALQAQQARDLPQAIALLERSFRLDPDNDATLADLTGSFQQFIDICIEEGNTKLALQYADRLIRVDARLAAALKDKVKADVQSNIISQKIDSLLRLNDFPKASEQAGRLGSYNVEKGARYRRKVIQYQVEFIAGKWLTNLLLWFPVLLILIALGQSSFPVTTSFSLQPFHFFVIGVTFLSALLAATLDSYKLHWYSYYTAVIFFTFGILMTFLGLYLVPDIALPIRIFTAVLLSVAAYITLVPADNAVGKITGAVFNLGILSFLCFSGDLLVHRPELPASEQLMKTVMNPPDVPSLIWNWVQSVIEISEKGNP